MLLKKLCKTIPGAAATLVNILKKEEHRCASSRGCIAEEIQAEMMVFGGKRDMFELHRGLEAGNPNPT